MIHPDRFDHSRFAPEARAAQHRYQYIPFGAGPRVCVGAGFAQQEVMTVIASVIRRYRLTMPAGFKPEPISRLTIRPRTGMKLLFERVG